MSNISSVDTTPHALSVSPEMGEFVQQLHRDQADLEKKLVKDTTRTKSAKKMFASEAAQKRLDMALKRAERIQESLAVELAKYDSRVEKLMQVRGTTDMLIMQNYAAALADKKPSEILKLNGSSVGVFCVEMVYPVVLVIDRGFISNIAQSFIHIINALFVGVAESQKGPIIYKVSLAKAEQHISEFINSAATLVKP